MKPTGGWWSRLKHWVFARQSLSIKEQFERFGVTSFVLNVKFREVDGQFRVADSYMEYGDFDLEELDFLDRQECALIVILDGVSGIERIAQEGHIYELCDYIKECYPHIRLLGGWSGETGELIYESMKWSEGICSSGTFKWREERNSWFARLKAKMYNRSKIQKAEAREYPREPLFLDFVEIR